MFDSPTIEKLSLQLSVQVHMSSGFDAWFNYIKRMPKPQSICATNMVEFAGPLIVGWHPFTSCCEAYIDVMVTL